jgi:hypothetical protein
MKCFLTDLMTPLRFSRRWPLLPCVLLLLTLVSYGQTPPPDVPSGFFPGTISIIAGKSGTVALTDYVNAFAIDSNGNIYVSALPGGGSFGGLYVIYGGNSVPPVLKTVAGSNPTPGSIYEVTANGHCTSGTCGDGSTLDKASFDQIISMSFDSSDNLYISDAGAYVVRRVDYNTRIVTTVAGQPFNESDDSFNINTPMQATSTPLNCPQDAKADGAGSLYIADACDNVVRVVYNVNNLTSGATVPPLLSLAGIASPTTGYIYTIAGALSSAPGADGYTLGGGGQYCQGAGSCGDNGPMADALFGGITSIDIDSAGNLYVLDNGNVGGISPTVRLIYAGPTTDDKPPSLLTVSLPQGQTTPTPGDIYVIAGSESNTCSSGTCGDGGIALQSQLNNPLYLRIDSTGNVYFTDFGDNTVRKVDEAGYISSVAGVEAPGAASRQSAGDGGPATQAVLYEPNPIAFDKQGNLYLKTPRILNISGVYIWQVAPGTPQTINFPALQSSTPTYGASPIPLGATASSNLDVYYSVTGPAKVVCPSGGSTTQSNSAYNSTAVTCAGNSTNAELNFTGAGTVTVTASQPGGTVTAESGTVSVYAPATAATGTSLTQTITVDKAPLTVTANSFSVTYGQFNPTVAGFYSASYNFVNGDTAATAFTGGSLLFSTTPTVTASSLQGTYTINVSSTGLTSTNYDVANATYISGTLTITGSTPQTINFQPLAPITYGQVKTINLTATASSGGPVSFAVAGGPGTISGSTLTITGGGTIKVVASQNGYEQYEAVSQEQDLVVNPVSLIVTAPSPTYPYGTNIATALSSTSPTITGWVGSDSSSLVTGSPAYTTSATSTSDPGSYPLQVAQGQLALAGTAATNYIFTNFVSGSITITKASQSINYGAPTSITYGGLPTVTATSSSGLPVTFAFTGPLTLVGGRVTNPSAGINSTEFNATGVGAASITITQAGTTDYAAAAPVVLSFTVGQAPLNVAAVNVIREQGATNPTLIYGIGGFVNNDTDIPSVVSGIPVLSTTATPGSSPGKYLIVVSQGTLAASNYYFVLVNGTLTVTPPGSYTITANPSSLIIQRGQSAQSTIIITPSNAYQGTITLSCGQLPANVSCTISPAIYTFPGSQNPDGSENPAQGTITINTRAATVASARPAEKSDLHLAGLLIPGAIAGVFLGFARKRVAKAAALLSLCALLTLGLGMLTSTSCGGSHGLTTTAPSSTTITISGSGTTPSGSGTVTASAPLTVTIQ